MTDQQGGDKEEKREEKDEKERGEKWRRDPLSALVWGAILIWAGIVFLVENLGFLKGLELLEPWSLVFIGAGVIVLIEALIRALVPEYRRPITGTVIFGVILLAVGLGDLVKSGLIWAILLIAGGVAILIGTVWKKS